MYYNQDIYIDSDMVMCVYMDDEEYQCDKKCWNFSNYWRYDVETQNKARVKTKKKIKVKT